MVSGNIIFVNKTPLFGMVKPKTDHQFEQMFTMVWSFELVELYRTNFPFSYIAMGIDILNVRFLSPVV